MPLPKRTIRFVGALWLLKLAGLATLGDAESALAAEPITLIDHTQQSQLSFRHFDGGGDHGYLVSLMGSGLALFDFDCDGRTDAFLLNGHELPQMSAPHASHSNGLFRNIGQGQFAEVTMPSHTMSREYGLGVSIGDIDNDGFPDVAISNFGSVTLLKNNGDGTFTDQTVLAGLANSGVRFGAGVAFLDVENDGDLDLFVADYVDFTFEQHERSKATTFPYPPGPEQFPHRHDRLFLNDGTGNFTDASIEAGISEYVRPSMGVACSDFDLDGDTDIFVCCDARPNLFLVNDGTGHFTNEAELCAVAYPASGIPVGSMGAEFGDIDNDGLEDLFVTSYSAQLPVLFHCLGEFGFEDHTLRSRTGTEVKPHANWGSCLVDLNNDGLRDLMIANGHLLKNAKEIESLTDYRVRNTLLTNLGAGRFESISNGAGSGLQLVSSSRGIAFDDLDSDGDLDGVVLNSNDVAHVLENRTATNHNWIEFILVGTRTNRDGIGARVTIGDDAGQPIQSSERRSGRGYQSYYGSRIHFGIADVEQVSQVNIVWPNHTQILNDVKANQIHVIVEAE